MHKVRRILARSIALATGIIMIATTAIFASPMKDVSPNHWAYNDIQEMQKRGLLLPSSQGEFLPNHYVTYFEFSQILAKATGYQNTSINPNIDPTVKKAISDNYEKQKPLIEAQQKNYKYWQKDANQEIAYLLGKGYIQKEDLAKFMSRSTTGVESKRGVRKQEAAVYLVRILHKAKTAEDEYVSTGFIDESKIEKAYRPFVAYMKKIGIVNGNEKGEYGPTEPITRATLSKMLIATLKINEAPVVPPTPEVPAVPEVPKVPNDKALEGKFTKMISNGNNGYYIVLEIEPAKTHTYSIEPTASVLDKNGAIVSLSTLKDKIDLKGGKDVIVTAQVELIGTTEYITKVKIIDAPSSITPPVVEKPVTPEKPNTDKEEVYNGKITGTIHSILIAPKSEITIQVDSRTQKTFRIYFDTKMYSNLKRQNIALWDLRLNQEVDLNVIDNEISTLEITKAGPPITLTGTIKETSVTGDKIEMHVSYDSSTQQTNKSRSINVPMETQILDGTIERGRKDLKAGMEVVIVYGEDEHVIPEQIIIISK